MFYKITPSHILYKLIYREIFVFLNIIKIDHDLPSFLFFFSLNIISLKRIGCLHYIIQYYIFSFFFSWNIVWIWFKISKIINNSNRSWFTSSFCCFSLEYLFTLICLASLPLALFFYGSLPRGACPVLCRVGLGLGLAPSVR